MALRKNNFNNTILIVIAIFVMGIGLTVGFFQQSSKTQIVAELQAKQNELEVIKGKLAAYQDLESEYEKLKDESNRLSNFIPNKEGQAEFVKELQDIAERHNVIIRSCNISSNVGSIKELPDYQVYKWELGLTCKYYDLLAFIDAFDNASRFIKVSNVSVKNSDDNLSVTMTLDLISKAAGEKVKS